jgi:hypothetical protein
MKPGQTSAVNAEQARGAIPDGTTRCVQAHQGTHVTRRIVLTGLTAATLLATTACGTTTTGQAQPAPGTATARNSSGSDSSGSSSGTPSSGTAGGSLDSTAPCSLLSSSEASSLGVSGQPQRQKIGSAQSCLVSVSGGGFIIGIRTNVGFAAMQANGGQLTDTTIGRHQAKQLTGGATGSCVIGIGVTASSRVDVTAHAGTTDSCPLTSQVAQLVEPKLP